MTDTVDVFFKYYINPYYHLISQNIQINMLNKGTAQFVAKLEMLYYTVYLQQRNDIKLSIEFQDLTAQQNHHGDF